MEQSGEAEQEVQYHRSVRLMRHLYDVHELLIVAFFDRATERTALLSFWKDERGREAI